MAPYSARHLWEPQAGWQNGRMVVWQQKAFHSIKNEGRTAARLHVFKPQHICQQGGGNFWNDPQRSRDVNLHKFHQIPQMIYGITPPTKYQIHPNSQHQAFDASLLRALGRHEASDTAPGEKKHKAFFSIEYILHQVTATKTKQEHTHTHQASRVKRAPSQFLHQPDHLALQILPLGD